MKRIEYSLNADLEILGITEYLLFQFGSKVTETRIQKLFTDINKLATHPYMGKSVDGHDQNLRQIFSDPNVVIYDIDDDIIEILHIVDARKDYMRLIGAGQM